MAAGKTEPWIRWAMGDANKCGVCSSNFPSADAWAKHLLVEHQMNKHSHEMSYGVPKAKIFQCKVEPGCPSSFKHSYNSIVNHLNEFHEMRAIDYFSKYILNFSGGAVKKEPGQAGQEEAKCVPGSKPSVHKKPDGNKPAKVESALPHAEIQAPKKGSNEHDDKSVEDKKGPSGPEQAKFIPSSKPSVRQKKLNEKRPIESATPNAEIQAPKKRRKEQDDLSFKDEQRPCGSEQEPRHKKISQKKMPDYFSSGECGAAKEPVQMGNLEIKIERMQWPPKNTREASEKTTKVTLKTKETTPEGEMDPSLDNLPPTPVSDCDFSEANIQPDESSNSTVMHSDSLEAGKLSDSPEIPDSRKPTKGNKFQTSDNKMKRRIAIPKLSPDGTANSKSKKDKSFVHDAKAAVEPSLVKEKVVVKLPTMPRSADIAIRDKSSDSPQAGKLFDSPETPASRKPMKGKKVPNSDSTMKRRSAIPKLSPDAKPNTKSKKDMSNVHHAVATAAAEPSLVKKKKVVRLPTTMRSYDFASDAKILKDVSSDSPQGSKLSDSAETSASKKAVTHKQDENSDAHIKRRIVIPNLSPDAKANTKSKKDKSSVRSTTAEPAAEPSHVKKKRVVSLLSTMQSNFVSDAKILKDSSSDSPHAGKLSDSPNTPNIKMLEQDENNEAKIKNEVPNPSSDATGDTTPKKENCNGRNEESEQYSGCILNCQICKPRVQFKVLRCLEQHMERIHQTERKKFPVRGGAFCQLALIECQVPNCTAVMLDDTSVIRNHIERDHVSVGWETYAAEHVPGHKGVPRKTTQPSYCTQRKSCNCCSTLTVEG